MRDTAGMRSKLMSKQSPPRKSHLQVLFINDTSRNGGPGRTLLDILKFLDATCVSRSVLIPHEGIVSQRLIDAKVVEELSFEPWLIENLFEPLSRQIERSDFDAPLPLKLVRVVGNIFRAAIAVTRLIYRVRVERYDVVFCNGTTANFVGGAIAALTGTPVIWHIFYPSVAWPIRRLHEFLAARKNVRSLVCVSQPTARQFAWCRHKLHIIHDALDIDEFDAGATPPALRTEFSIAPDAVIFGTYGRILRRKGVIEFIRAARIVVDKLDAPERSHCAFVVLGDTPQDMQPDHVAECRALVHELQLSEFVYFIGFRPEVRPYVGDFDVVAVPSVYDDPLPRTVMEAMALSKPVVAFNVGGIGEMIDDNVEGRLVRGVPPDVDGLAAACLAYFHDAELRRRHGMAARQRVEKEFDARSHAKVLQNEMFRVANGD